MLLRAIACSGGAALSKRRVGRRRSAQRRRSSLKEIALTELAEDSAVPSAADETGILARRHIEAAIIKPIYDEMRQAIGEA